MRRPMQTPPMTSNRWIHLRRLRTRFVQVHVYGRRLQDENLMSHQFGHTRESSAERARRHEITIAVGRQVGAGPRMQESSCTNRGAECAIRPSARDEITSPVEVCDPPGRLRIDMLQHAVSLGSAELGPWRPLRFCGLSRPPAG